MVPHVGDLSIEERGQIGSWMCAKIPGAEETKHLWLGGAGMAHAINLVLAHKQRALFEAMPDYPSTGSVEVQQAFRLAAAWQYQLSHHPPDLLDDVRHVDVDQECLFDFEQRLFERSEDSGKAGFYQWGLNAGPHQDRWDPYSLSRSEWTVDDWTPDGTESDWETVSSSICFQCLMCEEPINFLCFHQHGPEYIDDIPQPPHLPTPPPPKPARKKIKPRPVMPKSK